MDMTIQELHSVATTINEIAEWLSSQFISDDSTAVENSEKKPTLTLEEVRTVLAEKSRNGFTAEIKELLKKYGASKLSEVDSKDYKALLKDTEEFKNAT